AVVEDEGVGQSAAREVFDAGEVSGCEGSGICADDLPGGDGVGTQEGVAAGAADDAVRAAAGAERVVAAASVEGIGGGSADQSVGVGVAAKGVGEGRGAGDVDDVADAAG